VKSKAGDLNACTDIVMAEPAIIQGIRSADSNRLTSNERHSNGISLVDSFAGQDGLIAPLWHLGQ
jgi:hypothetical protein